MKTRLILATALIGLSATVSAAPAISPEIEQVLVEVCVNTQNDDRISLHKTLRQNRLSKQTAVAKVVCNNQSLLEFARSSEANKVVAMLTPYESRAKVSISDVVAP
jgi:hypothetical protein